MKDLFLSQKYEKERLLGGTYIARTALKSALQTIENNLIKVIVGPRRAGKSIFAIQLLRNKPFAYLNFDDERLSGMTNYDQIIKGLNEIYGSTKYLLFDEIQNLKKWELFANRLQRQGYILILTGSNSQLLSRELAAHLTGRYQQFTIYPFSFLEFLSARNVDVKIKSEQTLIEQGTFLNLLNEYLTLGGYPEIVVKGIEPRDYLRFLFDSIILKDVVKRYNVRYSKALYDLALFLVSNYSNEYTFTKLKNLLYISSVHTVQNYVRYLESAFLFFTVRRFSYKLKEQLKAPSKIYVYDTGLASVLRMTISPNYGRLMENIVAVELLRRGKEIYYYKDKNGAEVDFVVKDGLRIAQLIQVCYDVPDNRTKKKEIKPLLRAGKELSCEKLLMITWDYEAEESYNKITITYIPLWKWLTSPPPAPH